jgi:hypothetical protein
MAGVNPAQLFRRLALLSEAKLGLCYLVGIFPAAFLRYTADRFPGLAWLSIPAALLAIAAISSLVAVVAFYRDDDLLLAGVLLAAITGIGSAVAWAVTGAIVTGSFGGLVILAAGGFFVVVLRLVILAPIMAGIVWLARCFRRYLAPDSVDGAA